MSLTEPDFSKLRNVSVQNTGRAEQHERCERPWGDGVPEQWFQENIERFMWNLDDVRKAATPYADAMMQTVFAGVYFLLIGDDLRYIGKADSLNSRLVQHFRNGAYGADRAAILEAPSLFVRDVESYHIRKMSPPENRHTPAQSRYFET